MLRLTEYEIEDVRRLLADHRDYLRKWDVSECHNATAELVERIGEIYDVARARALRDAA